MPHRLFLSSAPSAGVRPVIEAFDANASALRSDEVRKVELVRSVVGPRLAKAGWVVADGPRSRGGVPLRRSHGAPVLADAASPDRSAALWVETGRSWTNNGFLEHLIEAVPCEGLEHIILAVRLMYDGSATYDKVVAYLEPVLASGRLGLPYKSVLVIGF